MKNLVQREADVQYESTEKVSVPRGFFVYTYIPISTVSAPPETKWILFLVKK